MIKSFVRPSDLQQLFESIKDERYTIIAGGTDIMVELHNGKKLDDKVVDISTINELKGVELKNYNVIIFAGTTHGEIEKNRIVNEHLPILSKSCSLVGSTLIRNRGTIGGNIVNNANCADSIPPLLLADTLVCIKGVNSERTIELKDFLGENGAVDLKEGEILYCLKAKTMRDYKWNLIKVGRRKSLAISRLTLAVALKEQDGIIEDLRLCPGAMLSKQARLCKTENKFRGEVLSSKNIEAIADSAVEEVVTLSGRRWSSEYKEPVLRGLIIRTLEEWRKKHEHEI